MPRFLVLAHPRTGATLLLSYLRNHGSISVHGEVLNDEHAVTNALRLLEGLFAPAGAGGRVEGVKITPEQLEQHGLSLSRLCAVLQIDTVLVVYREDALETFASRRIAEATGQWYCARDDAIRTCAVSVEVSAFQEFVSELFRRWRVIAEELPDHVFPVFIRYEDLNAHPQDEMDKVFRCLGLPTVKVETEMKRQNPQPLAAKISNFSEVWPQVAEVSRLRVPQLFEEVSLLRIPPISRPFIPSREPRVGVDGWRYRVSEPFLPRAAKSAVFDAVNGGAVSSASHWVRSMSTALKELFRVPVAQPCANGWAALVLALMCARIGPQDEVIVPSFTMVAVPNAVSFVGATPVFADNGPTHCHYNPTCATVLAVATPATKAVVVCHTYGVPAVETPALASLCRQRGWLLIEDISECAGVRCRFGKGGDADERLLGTFGDFACASLYANKILNSGDGGFVLAKLPEHSYRLQMLVNHGFTPSFHFVHFERSFNGKINGIGAALACGVLSEVDVVMRHRARLARWYRRYLHPVLEKQTIEAMPFCGVSDTPWVFGIHCSDGATRTRLRAFMAEAGIETRDYFFPLHLQPAYAASAATDGALLPNCEALGTRGLYLPTHFNLGKEDVRYIAATVVAFFSSSCSSSRRTLLPAPERPRSAPALTVEGFRLQARWYGPSGTCTRVDSRNSIHVRAVLAQHQLDTYFRTKERWDQRQSMLSLVHELLEETADEQVESLRDIYKHFNAYRRVLTSVEDAEDIGSPWLKETIPESEPPVPTTTPKEVQQLLSYLVRTRRCRTVLEIGCWLGGTTKVLAGALDDRDPAAQVIAMDGFTWQPWMNAYAAQPRQSKFLSKFQTNVQSCGKKVRAQHMPMDILAWPQVGWDSDRLGNQLDLVYFDITHEKEEMECLWDYIVPRLAPGRSVVVINGYGLSLPLLEFVASVSSQLRPLHKPHEHCKAFLYDPPVFGRTDAALSAPLTTPVVVGKLRFAPLPNWTHHHRGGFDGVMAQLRESFHDSGAEVQFIPAVEQYFCDTIIPSGKPLGVPWVGVIHQTMVNPETVYVPDLTRLVRCPLFVESMASCLGLFTLTTAQKQYLERHLPPVNGGDVLIQRLFYPLSRPVTTTFDESLLHHWAETSKAIPLVIVGSYLRDFDYFYQVEVPEAFDKIVLQGEQTQGQRSGKAIQPIPRNVRTRDRATEDEYNALLCSSVVFLSLKEDGAANTLVVECIARNTPIVAPRLSACVEYLGAEYPLLYSDNPSSLCSLLTMENLRRAHAYLAAMDKSRFSYSSFESGFARSAIIRAIPPTPNSSAGDAGKILERFDVTVSLCSYKRTHNLRRILTSLLHGQDFDGAVEVIVWNNCLSRDEEVTRICAEFTSQQADTRHRLRVIRSSENYYCAIRMSLASLMRSPQLLICDDDIFPEPHFVRTFLEERARRPKAVLCLRGHRILDHELDPSDPGKAWEDYASVRFVNDGDPEQEIHFPHMDTCLISKDALHAASSVPMPDQSFALVDDYWMGFVLSHYFGMTLWKIRAQQAPLVLRSEDSDTSVLALHTRPEVREARIRLYIHHMRKGWPRFGKKSTAKPTTVERSQLPSGCAPRWPEEQFIGFNVWSGISNEDIAYLAGKGVRVLRIGAVDVGEDNPRFDLHDLLRDGQPDLQAINRLADRLGQLARMGMRVILTLDKRIACSNVWRSLARALRPLQILAYDLINEPLAEGESGRDCNNISASPEAMDRYCREYRELINAVRDEDNSTPIIISSSFWGHRKALDLLPRDILGYDDNLVVTFHFYEPRRLTCWRKNRQRFAYPGVVPYYEAIHSDSQMWDAAAIDRCFAEARAWAEKNGVARVYVGEIGIARQVEGASCYMEDVLSACVRYHFSCSIYAFREPNWTSMNYENTPTMDVIWKHVKQA